MDRLPLSTPIVFLDIDGVLNHEIYVQSIYEKTGRAVSLRGENGIDDSRARMLNPLATAGAKFVISSTWRKIHQLGQLQDILANRGFEGEIIGTTPILSEKGIVRGCEIKAWLDDHCHDNHKRYVIFDDDSDMLLWQAYNFIRVDPWCGLTPNNIYKAQLILA